MVQDLGVHAHDALDDFGKGSGRALSRSIQYHQSPVPGLVSAPKLPDLYCAPGMLTYEATHLGVHAHDALDDFGEVAEVEGVVRLRWRGEKLRRHLVCVCVCVSE